MTGEVLVALEIQGSIKPRTLSKKGSSTTCFQRTKDSTNEALFANDDADLSAVRVYGVLPLLLALYVPHRNLDLCVFVFLLFLLNSLSLFLSVCLFLSLIFSPFLTLALVYQTHTIAHQYRFYFKTQCVYCITRETKAPARRYPTYNYSPSIQIHI